MIKFISKKIFNKVLKNRRLEDVRTIKIIETYLRKKRGYVFRMPKPGASVVLLLSGGLDSIVGWGILMKEYGLNVYPISFDLGEKRANKEKESIDYFSKFYKSHFPKLYKVPFRMNLNTGKVTLPIEKAYSKLHPEEIFRNFKEPAKPIVIDITFGSFTLLPIYAKLYAELLNHVENLDINTIFCSVLKTDGLLIKYQTFTSLRSIMYNLCVTSGDFKWQFTSLALEKEVGWYLGKEDIIKWGSSQGIPMEKTWSCWQSGKFQCGGSDCLACMVRRESFQRSKVKDNTVYRPLANQNTFFLIKRKFEKRLHLVFNFIKYLIDNRNLF